MVIKKNPERKMPLKTINNRRCLTECHPPDQPYFHPVILTGIANRYVNTCAVDPYYDRIADTIHTTDYCKLEDNIKFQPPDELSSLFLNFEFKYEDFLSNMYNLYSFDQVIYWTLENTYLPFDTIKRVHNCAWKAYGKNIQNLSDKVFEYYYELIKSKWIADYYNLLNKKFSFKLTTDGQIKISKFIDQGENNISPSEKLYDLIIFYYFNYSYFIRIFKKYIKKYQNQWESIDSHYGNFKKFCYRELFKNINKAVKDSE